jgi:hypothetical protein
MSSDFTSDDNIQLLWEVMLDENIFQSVDNSNVAQIQRQFLGKLSSFHQNESKKYMSLISMNKAFVETMYNQNTTTNTSQNPSQYSEPIKAEDLKSQRMNDFDNALKKQQDDLASSMTLKPPPRPAFEDSYDDKPINSMEDLIKRTMQERNYDIQQIQQGHTPKQQVEQFLKSHETSVRNKTDNPNEKLYDGSRYDKPPSNFTYKHVSGEQVKYIKIGDNDIHRNLIDNEIVELNDHTEIDGKDNARKNVTKLKRNISWAADESLSTFHDHDNNIKLDISQILPSNTNSPATSSIKSSSDKSSALFAKLKPKNTGDNNRELNDLQAKVQDQDNYIKRLEQQFIDLQSVVEKLQSAVDILQKEREGNNTVSTSVMDASTETNNEDEQTEA